MRVRVAYEDIPFHIRIHADQVAGIRFERNVMPIR